MAMHRPSAAELVAQYDRALQDLTINSKPIIITLTDIARENTPDADIIGRSVVNRIKTVRCFLLFCDVLIRLESIGTTGLQTASTLFAGLDCEKYRRSILGRVLSTYCVCVLRYI